jgi:hypothetical protein
VIYLSTMASPGLSRPLQLNSKKNRGGETERAHDVLARQLRFEIRERSDRLPPEEATSIEVAWLAQRLEQVSRE